MGFAQGPVRSGRRGVGAGGQIGLYLGVPLAILHGAPCLPRILRSIAGAMRYHTVQLACPTDGAASVSASAMLMGWRRTAS